MVVWSGVNDGIRACLGFEAGELGGGGEVRDWGAGRRHGETVRGAGAGLDGGELWPRQPRHSWLGELKAGEDCLGGAGLSS